MLQRYDIIYNNVSEKNEKSTQTFTCHMTIFPKIQKNPEKIWYSKFLFLLLPTNNYQTDIE